MDTNVIERKIEEGKRYLRADGEWTGELQDRGGTLLDPEHYVYYRPNGLEYSEFNALTLVGDEGGNSLWPDFTPITDLNRVYKDNEGNLITFTTRHGYSVLGSDGRSYLTKIGVAMYSSIHNISRVVEVMPEDFKIPQAYIKFREGVRTDVSPGKFYKANIQGSCIKFKNNYGEKESHHKGYTDDYELVYDIEEEPLHDTLIKWGEIAIDAAPCGDLRNFLYNHLYNKDLMEKAYRAYESLYRYRPEVSRKFPGKITMTMSRTDHDRDRQTAVKPGRAFKLLFPQFSDSEIDQMVDAFRDAFPIHTYTIKEGTEAKDFKHAYSHTQSVYQNLYTTSGRKSLANSCMRHGFPCQPHHPAEAYASGEWRIVWVEDDCGRIAARCVVWDQPEGKPQAGPVYGTSEEVIDLVWKHIAVQGAVMFGESSWWGAKMLRLPHNGQLIGPYLDQCQRVSDQGDHILIDEDGCIDACFYQGYFGESTPDHTCYHCEEGLSDDDAIYMVCNDEYVCEHCRDSHYTLCDYTNTYYPDDDLFYNCYILRGGNYYKIAVHESNMDDFVYCENADEYWHDNLVIYIDSASIYISPRELENGDYFQSDWDGGYYSDDELCVTVGGDTVAKSELDSDPQTWVEDENGKWKILDEEAA